MKFIYFLFSFCFYFSQLYKIKNINPETKENIIKQDVILYTLALLFFKILVS